MPIQIHGNQYVTVAERVQALHETVTDKPIEITTEFIPNGSAIVCRATVKIGANTFMGTSAANPSKSIEKQSPYEVAETSAIGRALGFAGYGVVDGIATADEVVKAQNGGYNASAVPVVNPTNSNDNGMGFTCKCGAKSVEKTVTPKSGPNAGQPVQILVCPNQNRENQADHSKPVWL
jgi:hypothetical protein